MTDLNRQLQEYLSQSRGNRNGNGADSEPLLPLEADSPEPSRPANGWMSRMNPFSSGQSGKPAPSQDSSPSSGGFWSTEPDPCLPALSRRQRLTGFGLCLAMGLLCFGLSALYAPFMLLRARKFALLFTLGSVFLLTGLALLRGPYNQLRLLLSRQHLPFTAAYLGSLFATLYSALALRSTALTAVAAAFQLLTLAGYLLSSIPGGPAGLRFVGGFLTSAFKRTVSKSLPV
ncbi:vesicle transport protein SFT2C [Hemiscyllium ocellatum]|uniref:vesicle transport protein SFT2C n=1 Tax=Hemiscyllium ocellatum TaxID=170820 RepID=UPI0029661A56|nr:vesicle transport protein SFT2C [Hemiscyllium ocellatum]